MAKADAWRVLCLVCDPTIRQEAIMASDPVRRALMRNAVHDVLNAHVRICSVMQIEYNAENWVIVVPQEVSRSELFQEVMNEMPDAVWLINTVSVDKAKK